VVGPIVPHRPRCWGCGLCSDRFITTVLLLLPIPERAKRALNACKVSRGVSNSRPGRSPLRELSSAPQRPGYGQTRQWSRWSRYRPMRSRRPTADEEAGESTQHPLRGANVL
jgi:hypothetical protein